MRRFMLIVCGILALLATLTGAYVAMTWAPEQTVDDLRARWAPAPSTFLNVAGMNVHVRDEGLRNDPSPIVLLHGTASSLHTWDGWAMALRSERRVIRLDLPGFGLTGPTPNRTYNVDEDVRVVLAVLDHLGIKRCVMGGNSLGGSIAWRIALAYPSRVEKLILVDSGGYPTRPASMPIAFYLAHMPVFDWMVRNTLPRFIIAQGLRSVYGDPDKVTPDLVERFWEITRREGNRRAMIDRGRQRRPASLDQPSLGHRIAELSQPTLILWGGRDRLIPADIAERFHRDIPGSKMVVFPGLGHVPQEEDPAQTMAAVGDFLGLQQISH
jgi:pimeloyl-ACP methyl ester carboxylesterase